VPGPAGVTRRETAETKRRKKGLVGLNPPGGVFTVARLALQGTWSPARRQAVAWAPFPTLARLVGLRRSPRRLDRLRLAFRVSQCRGIRLRRARSVAAGWRPLMSFLSHCARPRPMRVHRSERRTTARPHPFPGPPSLEGHHPQSPAAPPSGVARSIARRPLCVAAALRRGPVCRALPPREVSPHAPSMPPLRVHDAPSRSPRCGAGRGRDTGKPRSRGTAEAGLHRLSPLRAGPTTDTCHRRAPTKGPGPPLLLAATRSASRSPSFRSVLGCLLTVHTAHIPLPRRGFPLHRRSRCQRLRAPVLGVSHPLDGSRVRAPPSCRWSRSRGWSRFSRSSPGRPPIARWPRAGRGAAPRDRSHPSKEPRSTRSHARPERRCVSRTASPRPLPPRRLSSGGLPPLAATSRPCSVHLPASPFDRFRSSVDTLSFHGLLSPPRLPPPPASVSAGHVTVSRGSGDPTARRRAASVREERSSDHRWSGGPPWGF